MDKAPDAFRTISEVADELDIPQHVLRFWETRFSQIKPMKRSGGRRFYRPDDVDLLRGIRRLLYGEGYTIRGVQRILKEQGIKSVQALSDTAKAVPSLYALDDGVKTKIARGAAGDESGDNVDDDATHLDDAQDETPEPVPVAAPPRRPMATPLPRMDLARIDQASRGDVAPRDELRAEPRLEQRAEAAPRPAAMSPERPAALAGVSAPPQMPDRRPLDIIRLKAVMSDLIVCREMLDRAMQDR